MNHFAWWGIFVVTGIKIVNYPFDLIVAIIALSSVWFKRYFVVLAETKELATKLQKEVELKDEFLANTSHELRNPIHVILNVLQVIVEREKSSLNDKSVKDLDMVLAVGRRMSLMLNDLLDMAHLKERGLKLQEQSLSMHAIASGVIDMLRHLTEYKSLQINNDIPIGFPKVSADENRLIQVLFNLLHNAVKYSEEGIISIRAQLDNGKARILVEDTGIGIDEAMLQRLFEPYEQSDPGMAGAGGGLGLGLSICKQLVELHGGTLEVDSTIGEGSVFSFTLSLSTLR